MNEKNKILIVEDESIIAEQLRRIVENLGYKFVEVVHRYEDAIEKLEKNEFDLVLLDIGLDYSENDGIDLACFINKTYKIPFIYITANSDKITVSRAKSTFPNAFILKPFNEAAIFSNLEIVLHKIQPQKTFIVKQGGKNIVLDCSKITFVKSDNIYSEIYTVDNKKYLLRKYLKNVLSELNFDYLIQVHRCFLVNYNHIQSFNNDFLMINNTKIPIGDSFKNKIKDFKNKIY